MTDEPADPILAQAQALERRRKRKAEKRKNALARDSFLTLISGSPDQQALTVSMKASMKRAVIGAFGDRPAGRTGRSAAGPRPAPRAFSGNVTHGWVCIGPSVVRRGQADRRPRVSGRVRY